MIYKLTFNANTHYEKIEYDFIIIKSIVNNVFFKFSSIFLFFNLFSIRSYTSILSKNILQTFLFSVKPIINKK